MMPSNDKIGRAVRNDADMTAPVSPDSARRVILVRRRQRVPETVIRSHCPHAIETGCISVSALLADGRRQILAMLYPGDVLSLDTAPLAPDLAFVAMVATRLVAPPPPAMLSNTGSPSSTMAGVTRQLARATLHSMALGRLTGLERVATVLVELALALGQPIPGGYTFELPMSRQDLADYLAINPDTLSRLVSRLKVQGLISSPGRRTMIIKDFAAVAALTPLATALARVHGPATGTTLPA